MGVGILMSPSSKVQMRGELPGRGGGGEGRGVLKLGLKWYFKTKLESERGKFLIDFSSFFLIVAQWQYSITFPYYVKKRKEKITFTRKYNGY